MTDVPTYKLERTFNAPKKLVWRTWTEPDLLARWYGPNVETIIHQLDVKPGGLWLNEMKMGNGACYQRTEFLEVEQPDRLVCIMADCDQDWNIAPNPMMPDWPQALHTTVTFKETDGKTIMTLVWAPHNASDREIACFKSAINGMAKGWESGMDQMEALLSELAQ